MMDFLDSQPERMYQTARVLHALTLGLEELDDFYCKVRLFQSCSHTPVLQCLRCGFLHDTEEQMEAFHQAQAHLSLWRHACCWFRLLRDTF